MEALVLISHCTIPLTLFFRKIYSCRLNVGWVHTVNNKGVESCGFFAFRTKNLLSRYSFFQLLVFVPSGWINGVKKAKLFFPRLVAVFILTSSVFHRRAKKCRQNPRLVINSPLFFHYYFLEATECGLASSPPFWGRGGRLCDNDHNSPRKKRTRRRLKGKGKEG